MESPDPSYLNDVFVCLLYFYLYPVDKKHPAFSNIQGNQFIMAVFFCYLVKSDLPSVRYCTRAQDKSLFPRYRKKMAIFNWSFFILPDFRLLLFFMF